MSGASADVADHTCFLELVTKTPEFMGPDILLSVLLITANYFGIP